jgi:hypothetical protein
MGKKTNEQLLDMLREIDRLGMDLTDWEVGFVSDLLDDGVERFTPRQAECIERIWLDRVG